METNPENGSPPKRTDSTRSRVDVLPDRASSDKPIGFDRQEAVLTGVLLLLIVLGNVAPRILPEGDVRPIAVERGEDSRPFGRVDWLEEPPAFELSPMDLNEVDRGDLMAISGIGPSLSSAILDYREEHGAFASVSELDDVAGIGPRKLEVLSRYLFVRDSTPVVENRDANGTVIHGEIVDATETPGMAGPGDEAAPDLLEDTGATRKQGDRLRANLNEMTRDEFTGIPGIGESFATRILETREEIGRFRDWNEVDAIPGIGPKRLENLRKHATIR